MVQVQGDVWLTRRRCLYGFLETPVSILSYIYHIAVGVLIIVSALLNILSTVPRYDGTKFKSVFHLEISLLALLSAEYLLRLWCAPAFSKKYQGLRGVVRFIRRPLRLADLAILGCSLAIVIVTTNDRGEYLWGAGGASALRLLSLFRLLRFDRYIHASRLVADVLVMHWHELVVTFFISLLIILWGATIVWELEHDVQPDHFGTLPQAIYWALITATTVGYGDISPTTSAGQAVTSVLVLLGMLFISIPAGLIGTTFAIRVRQYREDRRYRARLSDTAARLVQLRWRTYSLKCYLRAAYAPIGSARTRSRPQSTLSTHQIASSDDPERYPFPGTAVYQRFVRLAERHHIHELYARYNERRQHELELVTASRLLSGGGLASRSETSHDLDEEEKGREWEDVVTEGEEKEEERRDTDVTGSEKAVMDTGGESTVTLNASSRSPLKRIDRRLASRTLTIRQQWATLMRGGNRDRAASEDREASDETLELGEMHDSKWHKDDRARRPLSLREFEEIYTECAGKESLIHVLENSEASAQIDTTTNSGRLMPIRKYRMTRAQCRALVFLLTMQHSLVQERFRLACQCSLHDIEDVFGQLNELKVHLNVMTRRLDHKLNVMQAVQVRQHDTVLSHNINKAGRTGTPVAAAATEQVMQLVATAAQEHACSIDDLLVALKEQRRRTTNTHESTSRSVSPRPHHSHRVPSTLTVPSVDSTIV